MKITDVTTLVCDAGWRPWVFVKMETDKGITGYSEITDSNGSPRGMMGVVEDLKPVLVGRDPRQWARNEQFLHRATRQSSGGVVQKAIAGCVNAMLDITGKHHGVPVYALFGGPSRTEFPVYWSHFGTTRVRAYEVTQTPRLATIQNWINLLAQAHCAGYEVVKTNILHELGTENPHVYMPGAGRTMGGMALNLDPEVLASLNELAASAAMQQGPRLAIDLNFNFKPEGFKKVARALERHGLAWLELDTYSLEALLEVKRSTSIPICSGENLYTLREYEPFLRSRAMDIASIDLLWNGFPESVRIANLADLHGINVAPHNFNGALGDAIAAHFSALVPNLRMCEYDLDDVPWKYAVAHHDHVVKDGTMTCSDKPGWGVEFHEEVLAAHPWPKP